MAIIEKGSFFWDPHAVRDFREKDKYFIVLTDGDYEDDLLVCFSLNTEKRMDLYNVLCNRKSAKFILSPDLHRFSFLKKFTSLNLAEPCLYSAKELFETDIKILEQDKAELELLRQIKNCIDNGYLLPKHIALIKNSFSSN